MNHVGKSLIRFCAAVCCAISLMPQGLGYSQSIPHFSATQTSSSPTGNDSRWVGNTSGPFYTGTADVEPGGSFYVEPYLFNYRSKGMDNIYLPTKFAYGLGLGMEFDVYVPLDLNRVSYPQAPQGKSASYLGYGDTLFQLKWQFAKEKNRVNLWALPSLDVSFAFNVPTGKDKSSNPNLYGASQTSNGTWNEQVNFLLRKQFKPFELYWQATELVQDPTNVTGPYQFNNGIGSLAAGQRLHMVDGNVLGTAGAMEHVLLPKEGFGYLIEYDWERQYDRSLFFGKANAPSFTYLGLSPELEVTWPNHGKFPVTWAAGTTFTAARADFPAELTPIFTVTWYGDLHGSR